MLNQIEELSSKAFSELTKVTNLEELEGWRVCYLGRKSTIVQALRSLATLPLEERRNVGARANEIKNAFEIALAEKKGCIEVLTISSGRETLDVSLPGKQISRQTHV